jgi:hypothetical protein
MQRITSGGTPIRLIKETFPLHRLAKPVGVVLAALAIGLGLGSQAVNASSQAERAAEVLQTGDSKMAYKIAKKTVEYAVTHWKIADFVTDTDRDRATKEVYDFLKWKLGNPSAICAQYVTGDYKHFQNGYGDEAAASLLGFNLPDDKGQGALPEWFIKYLQAELAKGSDSAVKWLVEQGVPEPVARLIVKEAAAKAGKAISRLGFNYPKSWDIDNKLVENLIALKRKKGPLGDSKKGVFKVPPKK